MKDYLIHVDVPEKDESYPVIVKNAENEMHARLAAYCLIYKEKEQPNKYTLLNLTTVEKVIFACDAKYYGIFEDD